MDHPLRRSTSINTQAGLLENCKPAGAPSSPYTGSFMPCVNTLIDGSDRPSLIRFGTTTERYAMPPYGSPSGVPLASLKSALNVPVRLPKLTTLYQPVPVILAPA